MTGAQTDLRLRLQAITRRVNAARQDVAAGMTIDLAEVKDEVVAICEQLRAAPLQIDRQAMAGEIEALIADFDKLETELTAQHERLGGGGTET